MERAVSIAVDKSFATNFARLTAMTGVIKYSETGVDTSAEQHSLIDTEKQLDDWNANLSNDAVRKKYMEYFSKIIVPNAYIEKEETRFTLSRTASSPDDSGIVSLEQVLTEGKSLSVAFENLETSRSFFYALFRSGTRPIRDSNLKSSARPVCLDIPSRDQPIKCCGSPAIPNGEQRRIKL
ncbi:AAEL004965-PA [Aedes aegypti]|uniref:AAEL004965-PA n=1 Tax=Aedes aegypti TaxID=7159 RepID=Q17BH4_AEDAE|nr:AAEL004965-PA [Aedes aegypti]